MPTIVSRRTSSWTPEFVIVRDPVPICLLLRRGIGQPAFEKQGHTSEVPSQSSSICQGQPGLLAFVADMLVWFLTCLLAINQEPVSTRVHWQSNLTDHCKNYVATIRPS